MERASRSGWRWWFVVPVLLGLAVWWAGWGIGGTGGWVFSRTAGGSAIPAPPGSRTTETLANAGAKQPLPNAAGTQKQAMAGPGVQVLTASNKSSYIGKQFAVNAVPVQQKVSSRAMWIGENAPMLAVVTGNAAIGGIEAGKIVDAKGTVQKAPPANQAKQEWALSDHDASRLEHEGAYIQVSQLTVPPQ